MVCLDDPGLSATAFQTSTPNALALQVGCWWPFWCSQVVLALFSVVRLLSLRLGTTYRLPHRAQAPAQFLRLPQIVAPAFGETWSARENAGESSFRMDSASEKGVEEFVA